ncbi:MAG: hypothetical protein IPF93_25565 [Saprospiraceae bacterium]|nr:hypothetical protein [Saprospiraceae bacterium]
MEGKTLKIVVKAASTGKIFGSVSNLPNSSGFKRGGCRS